MFALGVATNSRGDHQTGADIDVLHCQAHEDQRFDQAALIEKAFEELFNICSSVY